MKNITDCIHDEYGLENKLYGPTKKFANVMTKSMNRYSFKSIYNTDNVIYMGHHMALRVKKGTRSQNVAAGLGVMSHYRDHMYSSKIKPNKWQKIFSPSIIDWFVDVEFFFLIVNTFK
jgi:hypothetical protein